jgi:hypothetical protein
MGAKENTKSNNRLIIKSYIEKLRLDFQSTQLIYQSAG